MKKTIIIITLTILLSISVIFNVIDLVNNKTNTNTTINTYLSKIEAEITSDTTDYSNDEDLNLYIDISTANLAVLVSNKDYPESFINIVAKNHGYDGYTDMVNKLIDWNLLVYIPEYTHSAHGLMCETIVTPNTVGYELAVEEGIIKEVK